MGWNQVRTCHLFSSLLSFLPEPISQGCDPQVFHRLRCTGATEANSGNGYRFTVLPCRFVCRQNIIGHMLQPEMALNTLPPLPAHALTLLRLAQQLGQDSGILPGFLGFFPAVNQHPAFRRNQLTLPAHIRSDNRHSTGHRFVDRERDTFPFGGGERRGQPQPTGPEYRH